MAGLEKDDENKTVVWAKKRGFLTPKVRFVENGYPDRLFLSPHGHTIFIEFKRQGEKPEKLQLYRIAQLKARGIPAFWVDTYDEAVFILKAAVDTEGVPQEGNSSPVVTSIRRAIVGPGVGQDSDGPRYDKDSSGEEPYTIGTDRGSPPGDPTDVA